MNYSKQKKLFLEKNPACAVYPGKLATDIHHVRGRLGKLCQDERHWLGVSRDGHSFIHNHPELARENGWLCAKGLWNKYEP